MTSKSPLETITLSEDSLAFIRYNGKDIELCVSEEGICVVKKLSEKQALFILNDLLKYFTTSLEKSGKI